MYQTDNGLDYKPDPTKTKRTIELNSKLAYGKTTQSVHCTITGPCLRVTGLQHVQCTDSVIMPSLLQF